MPVCRTGRHKPWQRGVYGQALVSRGAEGKGDFDHQQIGIQRVSRFIFSETFHIDKAITFASRAAYISALIRVDSDLCTDDSVMSSVEIPERFKTLVKEYLDDIVSRFCKKVQ